MVEVVLLRILTEKSILGFGKHADKSVRQIIDLGKSQYLRWVYFNMSGISFMEDILIKIHIPQDYWIGKPGKNPDLHVILNENHFKNLHFKARSHMNKRIRCVKITGAMSSYHADRVKFSKDSLVRANHGHKNK